MKLLSAEEILALDRGALAKLVVKLQVDMAETGKKDAHNFSLTHVVIEEAKRIQQAVDEEVARRERTRTW